MFFFFEKLLIGDSSQNTSKKNIFTKNTSNKNTTKHTLNALNLLMSLIIFKNNLEFKNRSITIINIM